MQPFAEMAYNEFRDLHDQIAQAIEGLSPAALDWSPGPDVNSIAVLAVHVVGAERYWLGDVVARDPKARDRPAEFATQGVDAAALIAGLEAATEYARGVLAALTLDDLHATRISPRDGREMTVAYGLNHILAHTAQHLGHIEVTRHWWEATHG